MEHFLLPVVAWLSNVHEGRDCACVKMHRNYKVAITMQIWSLQEGLTKPRANEHQALESFVNATTRF